MLRYVMYTEESTTHFDEGDKLLLYFRFREDLAKISKIIQERNQERGEFEYHTLLPENVSNYIVS